MPKKKKQTILLVGNEATTVKSEKSDLEKMGYSVIIKQTGKEAVTEFKANKAINLVLIDIVLGKGIDGAETATKLQKERNVPLLFFTSRTEPKLVEKAGSVASYGYVLKNSGMAVIDRSIKTALKLFSNNQRLLQKINKMKKEETAVKENKDFIKIIMDNLPIGIAVRHFDPVINFLYMNDNFSTIYRTNKKILSKPDKFRDEIYEDKALRETIKKQGNSDKQSSAPEGLYRTGIPITDQDKKTRYITERNIPLPEQNLIITTIWDMTDCKRIELELRDNKNFIEKILNTSPDIIYIYDIIKKKNIYSNIGMTITLGYTVKEIKDMGNTLIKTLMHKDDFKYYVNTIIPQYKTIKDNKILEHEYRMKHKNGEWRWLHSKESIFARRDDSSPSQIFGIITDITERKKIDITINNLLAEKDLLLKEVHHRIKNNIDVIINLLTLQSESVKIPEAASILDEAISRLQTMEVLYTHLYKSDTFREISTKQYLTQLIEEIDKAFLNNTSISIKTSIDDIKLTTKKLFPLGIILNELITNSIKHAFQNKKDGEINVTVSAKTGLTVKISDNGTGFSRPLPGNREKGFGLTLVDVLTEQLNGTFSIKQDHGTTSVLTFPLS